MRSLALWLALSASVAGLAQSGGKSPLAQANAALQAGEADRVLSLLAQPGNSAEAYNLRCRVEYALEQWERAVSDCEQAVKLDGNNSDDHLWLGRAIGEKASRASFVSAYGLGKRTRMEFEEAARLNPRNVEALADLGEFYYSAPSVVGGGSDKAETVATQLEHIDLVRAHELRGHIAEERKDNTTAEREFKQALAASAHPANQWVTLASFHRRRQQWNEMDAELRSAESAASRDKSAAAALYEAASILIRADRDPARAVHLLEAYLASNSKTEDAPAFVAHLKLARLKQKLGDRAAAERERAAALSLARAYKPAQDWKP